MSHPELPRPDLPRQSPRSIFPNGSATGLGQFIDLRPTLLNVVKRLVEVFKSKTF